MSIAGYLLGLVCLGVVFAGFTAIGLALARRLLPDATGALYAVSSAVMTASALVIAGEILGTAGIFSRVPLVLVGALGGIGSVIWLRRQPRRDRTRPRLRAPQPVEVVAILCVALVLAVALVAIASTATTGNLFLDADQYHLVWAAHFTTSHSTTSIIQTGIGDATTYYPLNDELLHGMAMSLLGRDTFSMLITTIEMLLMFGAAYAFGREFDQGPLAVCAVSPLLATFGSLDANALNDWAAMWPFVAALALIAHCYQSRDELPSDGPLLLIGLAIGLAIGTKLDVLVPGLAVGLAVAWLARARLGRACLLLLLGGIGTGGYWLVRDFVSVGSPLPSEHLPGLPRIPMPTTDPLRHTVAHYFNEPHVWRAFFAPGLKFYFGITWPLILLVAAAGLALAVLTRQQKALVRALGIVGLVATIGYLITPTTAAGPEGTPALFKFNIRYELPGLAIALLLLCTTRFAAKRRTVVAALLLICLVGGVARSITWATGGPLHPAVATVVALAIAAAVWLVAHGTHRTVATAGALALVVAALGAYPLQQRYLRDRYHPAAEAVAAACTSCSAAVSGLFSPLRDSTGLKIGVVGRPAVYPLLGPQWKNEVSLVADLLPNHSFVDYASCEAWRRASSHYDVVVLETNYGHAPAALAWTASAPQAQRIFSDAAGTVFRIEPGYASAPC